ELLRQFIELARGVSESFGFVAEQTIGGFVHALLHCLDVLARLLFVLTGLADETAFEVFARLLKILRGVLLIQFANCVVKFLRKERLVGFSFFADFFHALQNIGVIGALLRELAREFVLAAGVAQ